MSILSANSMHDEAAAFAHVEAILWADGPVCPRCGSVGNAYVLEGVRSKASAKNPEGVVRHGLKKCRDCQSQFTVRVGTIFESSHVALHLWLQAIHLMCSSKKGISSQQLHRTLEVTLKTDWFMSHRIREAMRDDGSVNFGAGGGVVEVDETFIGNQFKKSKTARGGAHKNKVLTLIDRTTGAAKSVVVKDLRVSTLLPILRANIAKEATVYTDEAKWYAKLSKDFAHHDFTTHAAEEYVRGDVHTNTVEGYFSVFKRGMKGVYQHCSKKHLHRYAAEFAFRYSNRVANGIDDVARSDIALVAVAGKRLTYKEPTSR